MVAGDLYDRAVPSAEAVRVYTRRAGAHPRRPAPDRDHARQPRLGPAARRVRASSPRPAACTCAPEPSAGWPAGAARGRARPGRLLRNALPGAGTGPPRLGVPTARGHAGVLGEAMRGVRADLAIGRGVRSVVLAHAFVTGGEPTESERTIAVGGVEQVSGSVFDGVDYVALGHLHGPQELAESCATRAVRWPTRSPRRGNASRSGWSTWTRRARRGHGGTSCPCRARLATVRGRSTNCSPTRARRFWKSTTCRSR